MANAIRALAMDAVQKANSGHPGMPMGMAEIAVALWARHLRHNPADPKWIDRDRFVVSNGHGSMLLYALLHLSGYALSMDEIKNFRQLHSKTPASPMQLAWPWQSLCRRLNLISPGTRSLTITPMCFWATAA